MIYQPDTIGNYPISNIQFQISNLKPVRRVGSQMHRLSQQRNITLFGCFGSIRKFYF